MLGLEAYLFYRGLVIVFETRPIRSWLFYAAGYGLPLLIVLVTIVVSFATGSELYLRYVREQEREVESGRVNILLPGLIQTFQVRKS